MRHLLDMPLTDLSDHLARWGQPAYRAAQVWEWVWKKNAADFAAMSNLPAALRQQLGAKLAVFTAKVVRRSDASDGTIKLLLEFADGARIETVMIPSENRYTACLSTQAGCAMACTFCASGQNGLERNLTSGEIVEQILQLQCVAGVRISHVVIMGMGEPLMNYDATVAAIRAMNDPQRLEISARRITLSTVGLPKMIRKLAREELPITLSISLHAPNDAIRRELMPRAAQSHLEDVVAAAQDYHEQTGRRITLEYVILPGVNDTGVCATGLSRIAHRLEAQINLIRYNPVPGSPYTRPSLSQTEAFADRLIRLGANVQVRRSRGVDADAACGQLRASAEADRPQADAGEPPQG